MFTKDTSDAERTKVLSEKILKVYQWDKEKEFILDNPDIKVKTALMQYVKDLGIVSKKMPFGEYAHDVAFTSKTLKESISQTISGNGDLKQLAKAFSIIEKITENAVLLEVEPYRHPNKRELQKSTTVWSFVSAFLDDDKICPVKLTVMQKDDENSSKFYMILSVGKIKKEAFTIAENASEKLGESSPSGNAYLTISIPDFLKKCNRKQQVLLKNFPDGLLAEEQKKIKEKVRSKDRIKDAANLPAKDSGLVQNADCERTNTYDDYEEER